MPACQITVRSFIVPWLISLPVLLMRSHEAAGTNAKAANTAITRAAPIASLCLGVHFEKVKGIIKSEIQNDTSAPREAVRNKAMADSIIRPRYVHACRALFSVAAKYSAIGMHRAIRSPTSLGFMLKGASRMACAATPRPSTEVIAEIALPASHAFIKFALCACSGANCQINQAKDSNCRYVSTIVVVSSGETDQKYDSAAHSTKAVMRRRPNDGARSLPPSTKAINPHTNATSPTARANVPRPGITTAFSNGMV